MASRSQIRLSKTSRMNMKNHPATVERSTYNNDTYLVYCSSKGHRSYIYCALGSPLVFNSFESAQQFINTYK